MSNKVAERSFQWHLNKSNFCILWQVLDKDPWAVTSCLNEDRVPTAGPGMRAETITDIWPLVATACPPLVTCTQCLPGTRPSHWSLGWSPEPLIGPTSSSRKISTLKFQSEEILLYFFSNVKYRIDGKQKHLWIAVFVWNQVTKNYKLWQNKTLFLLLKPIVKNSLLISMWIWVEVNQSMKSLQQSLRRKVMYFWIFIFILATGIAMLCHFYVDVLNPSSGRWNVSIQKSVNSSKHQDGVMQSIQLAVGSEMCHLIGWL